MKIAYLYLAIAIVTEVIATTALKASEQFTRPIPTVIVVLGYGTAFYMLSLALRTLPVGIAYAIWAGLGILLVAVAGAVVYRQVPDLPAMIGMAMIVGGVVVIHVFSETVQG
ncbi:DMT family transporter [Microbulbifer rhizosphaerae]|uniref:Small multidrug resistance pump n=1 Tax=Microbulbifer rhizosphaerae TaxID=1562603 RepID=A0A7W4W9V5_9GAMM|nr:multidrug efflux SMR transporter [Microbulbifer rhizosphaerae]MBB3060316.1 small multidrug resistance pump [Microbulbifer rhizosphaerae]